MFDSNQIGNISGIIALVTVVARELFNACNHKRLRSTCCNRQMTTSIDIESTTPPPPPPPAQP